MGTPTFLRSLAAAALSGLLLLAMPAAAQTFPKLAGNPVVDQADIIPAAEEAALNAQLLELGIERGLLGGRNDIRLIDDAAGQLGEGLRRGGRGQQQQQPGQGRRCQRTENGGEAHFTDRNRPSARHWRWG